MLYYSVNPEKPPILQIQSLVKDFPQVRAVDGISFRVLQGTCLGILGPNGAGKTTTIEIIEGLSVPTSGTVLYKGKPCNTQFKEEIGIQFQQTALQEYQTCREVLLMFSHMYQNSVDLEKLISLCKLNKFADRDVHKLSGGERQRLLLAAALVNDPQLLFLDEPTTGLDPQARQSFWDIVCGLKEQGKTFILTTHYMDEAYTLCDELIIMNHGKIIAEGPPDKLLKQYFAVTTLKLPVNSVSLSAIPDQLKPQQHGDVIEMYSTDMNEALKTLMKANIDLKRLTIQEPTLENLFLHLTSTKTTINA